MSKTSNTPFRSATLKLQRAGEHLDEMERAKHRITHGRPKEFVFGQSPDGTFFVAGMLDDKMPEEFSLVVGDAVHNLRSALDHIAVALTTQPIRTNSSQSKTKVYFPATAGDRESFQ